MSSLDLISNKNDNHKYKCAHDMMICIWNDFQCTREQFHYHLEFGGYIWGFRRVLIPVTRNLSAEYDSNTIYSVLYSETGGNIPATISVSSTWPVCSVFLRRVITCSHCVYLRIQLVLRRWVIRSLFSFRCSFTIKSRIFMVKIVIHHGIVTDLCKPNFISYVNTGFFFIRRVISRECYAQFTLLIVR